MNRNTLASKLIVVLAALGCLMFVSVDVLLDARQSPVRPNVAPSGRATTAVPFDGRLMGGGRMWLNRSTSHSGPAWMTIDYGQPHARGRTIFGAVVPYGRVWRLGANTATHLTLDLHVRIGELEIPRGGYTLYMLPREDGADLVVSKQTRQWGTEYDDFLDLGRVPLRRRSLPETVESLAITLQPSLSPTAEVLPAGLLRIAWGTMEFSVDWEVVWQDSE